MLCQSKYVRACVARSKQWNHPLELTEVVASEACTNCTCHHCIHQPVWWSDVWRRSKDLYGSWGHSQAPAALYTWHWWCFGPRRTKHFRIFIFCVLLVYKILPARMLLSVQKQRIALITSTFMACDARNHSQDYWAHTCWAWCQHTANKGSVPFRISLRCLRIVFASSIQPCSLQQRSPGYGATSCLRLRCNFYSDTAAKMHRSANMCSQPTTSRGQSNITRVVSHSFAWLLHLFCMFCIFRDNRNYFILFQRLNSLEWTSFLMLRYPFSWFERSWQGMLRIAVHLNQSASNIQCKISYCWHWLDLRMRTQHYSTPMWWQPNTSKHETNIHDHPQTLPGCPNVLCPKLTSTTLVVLDALASCKPSTFCFALGQTSVSKETLVTLSQVA